MRKQSRVKPGSFLHYAMRNLEQINAYYLLGPSLYTNEICVASEQYAEKMCKEALVQMGASPNWVHDLTNLLKDIELAIGEPIPDDLYYKAAFFDDIYISSRYPDETGEIRIISEDDADLCREYALSIGDWVNGLIAHPIVNRSRRPSGFFKRLFNKYR